MADLVARLTESISRFLDTPFAWTRDPASEEEEQTVVAQVRREVSSALHDLAVARMVNAHLAEWRVAYDGAEYRGTGSTFRRARTIHGIYDAAAPLPDAVMTSLSVTFLVEIRRMVTAAIETSGGSVRLSDAA